MATKGRKSKVKAVATKEASIGLIEAGFIPLFNSKVSIEKDENGTPVKGTALMIYQGYMNSIIEWKDDKGEDKAKPIKKFVFAIKATDGTYKCLDVTVNKLLHGNLFDRLLKGLGIEDYFESTDDDDEDGFNQLTVLNQETIDTQQETLRGMAYTAELERVATKKGGKIYQIVVDSIKPLLDKEGNHKRKLPVEKTDPRHTTFGSTQDD
ncbi:MAG: hypothetical protein F6J96_34185 [Symploca sp. SIO1C2]|nr:hypothetical protein [Symploca sp. SIO1C2]